MCVLAIQVDLARRHFEMPVNEMNEPVGEVPRKKGTVIKRAIFEDPARDIDARILLVGDLDVRECFVVP
jgi:hypothetical protein